MQSRWLAVRPETWRSDLLRIVLLSSSVLGAIVALPSIVLALQSAMYGIAVLDVVALSAVFALTYFERIPSRIRAACACSVFYVVGAGLMIGVGSISQIYLFGFSLLTTLLLSGRWGLATVGLNAVTMLSIGFVGIAAPEMAVTRWTVDFKSWSVITSNFVFVNASLVLALGAVLRVLESALDRSVASRAQLEHEQTELVRLNRSLEEEVRQRTRNESSLRESRTLLRIAGLTARIGGWRVLLTEGQVVWSDEVCELHGLPPGTSPSVEEAFAFYAPESREVIGLALAECGREGTPFDVEAMIVTASGARLWVRTIGHAVRDAKGAIHQIHGSIQDVTPQKRAEERAEKLEEQFRQAQKMETVGNLAGGIAHDFNNLLSVVLSYSQLLAADLAADDPMRADLEEIRGAGLRAVELTRQLLAFSRRQVLEPRIVDLTEVVSRMEKMLRRLIGEDVELSCSAEPNLGSVLVDAGQIEQVILNLAVNARDAMPRGGMLTIETANVFLDDAYASEHVGVTAGMHVMLAVSDTGVGMDAATKTRMFEPFFTTKGQGKGTGLGLATVFGVVQQSGGTIWVYSELDRGTTFKIYFPIAKQTALPAATNVPTGDSVDGKETILLVEDEQAIRTVTGTILRRHGYTVLEAQSGGDALLLCEQHTAPIQLLLTDVVMPRMSGRELAERLQPLRPEMKVLYMSGYTDDAIVRHGVLDATLAFIQKPITPDALLRKVREVLSAHLVASAQSQEIRSA